MPDPVATPSAPSTITPDKPADTPFPSQMEEALKAAFAEARPDQFKAPAKPSVKNGSVAESADEETTASLRTSQQSPAKEAESPLEKPPAKAAQWKEVNEERARLRAENEQFKKEQEKYKTWADERKNYEEIKTKNYELTELVKTVALERLPEFKKHFDDRRAAAVAVGAEIVGEAHAATLKKIAQIPDGEFRNRLAREMLGELDEFQKAEIGPVLADLRKIAYEREAALAKAPEHLKAYESAQQRQRESNAKKLNETFDSVLAKWSDPEKGLALFQTKDGDDDHNARVKERIETAKNIKDMNIDPEQWSKAVLWAASAPGLLQDLIAERKENKLLREENESLKSGGPELKGGGEGQGQSTEADDKKYAGMSYGEIMAAKANEAGGWNR